LRGDRGSLWRGQGVDLRRWVRSQKRKERIRPAATP
jgi:hypothetical protein